MIKQRDTRTSVSVRYAIDEWFSRAELEDSTRDSYPGDVNRVIMPGLGHVAVMMLGARELETF